MPGGFVGVMAPNPRVVMVVGGLSRDERRVPRRHGERTDQEGEHQYQEGPLHIPRLR